MMKQLRPFLPYAILLGLGIIVLDLSFGRVIHFANDYFFGDTNDAYKNYYAPAYYVKYDTGTQLSGMNYPYGEQVVFTDNQPLLSWTLGFVHRNLFPIADYVPAIINWLLIFSLLGAMWWLFLILRRMKLPDWYAIPMAILIATLSPQIHRFTGHFALGYAFIVPMLWYQLLRDPDAKYRWLSLLGIVLTITLTAFLHAYYLLMGVIFAFSFFGGRGLGKWTSNRKEAWKDAGRACLTAATPILIFQLFMFMNDSVADRPDFPYGFFEFRARLSSVFLPVMGPFWEAWSRFTEMKRHDMEAFSYVGLVATTVGILSLVKMARYVWMGHKHRLLAMTLPAGMKTSLFAGIAALLFSMGIPFIWGLESLADHLGPLRQFRSLGRFAWIFYYIYTAYVSWYLFLLFRRIRQKGLPSFAYGLLAISIGLWAWESALQLQTHTSIIKGFKRSNVFKSYDINYHTFLDSAGVKAEDFQAVLPIPAFITGSDKFVSRYVSRTIVRQAFNISYETGLPLIAGILTRTSISQSKKLIQILSNKHVRKDLLDDLPNEKPILILKQNKVPITLSQQRVIHRAKLLYQTPTISLYQMDLEQLEADTDFTKARYRALQRIDTLRWNEFLVQPAVEWMHFDGFDSTANSPFGSEYAYADKGPMTIFSGSVPAGKTYQVSIWLKIDPTIAGFPILFFKEFDANGKEVAKTAFPSMFGNELYKDWQLIEGSFTPKNSNHRIELVCEGEQIGIESLLIRPRGADIFLGLSGEHDLMFNNYYLE